MSTPRKVTQETWFDIWAEWPPADRAAAIKALELTNRQLLKMEARTVEPKKDTGAGAAGEQERLALMATGNKADS